jgi:hypothetical protein
MVKKATETPIIETSWEYARREFVSQATRLLRSALTSHLWKSEAPDLLRTAEKAIDDAMKMEDAAVARAERRTAKRARKRVLSRALNQRRRDKQRLSQ